MLKVAVRCKCNALCALHDDCICDGSMHVIQLRAEECCLFFFSDIPYEDDITKLMPQQQKYFKKSNLPPAIITTDISKTQLTK